MCTVAGTPQALVIALSCYSFWSTALPDPSKGTSAGECGLLLPSFHRWKDERLSFSLFLFYKFTNGTETRITFFKQEKLT